MTDSAPKKIFPLPQIYLWLTGEVITRNSLSPIAAGHHKLGMERGEAKKINAIFKGAVSPDQISPIVISMDLTMDIPVRFTPDILINKLKN
jgi:hypothetical protein